MEPYYQFHNYYFVNHIVYSLHEGESKDRITGTININYKNFLGVLKVTFYSNT